MRAASWARGVQQRRRRGALIQRHAHRLPAGRRREARRLQASLGPGPRPRLAARLALARFRVDNVRQDDLGVEAVGEFHRVGDRRGGKRRAVQGNEDAARHVPSPIHLPAIGRCPSAAFPPFDAPRFATRAGSVREWG